MANFTRHATPISREPFQVAEASLSRKVLPDMASKGAVLFVIRSRQRMLDNSSGYSKEGGE